MAQQMLDHYCRLDPISIVLDKPITISPTQKKLLSVAIERLTKHEPIQYVLGRAHFLGRTFQVSPAVLIPRPETEALVQDIISQNRKRAPHVLDIGTGSGCIAITLQKELPQAIVHALEVDSDALHMAKINAQRLGAKVHFIHADVLHTSLPDQYWDIIVSNPPYVRLFEQKQMQPRVLFYEPAKALFVPNAKPLLFYEKIAILAPQHLRPAGKLYLEINEALGIQVARLLSETGLQRVGIRKDLHGKDRWVVGTWRA